jgi:hypothetical protein
MLPLDAPVDLWDPCGMTRDDAERHAAELNETAGEAAAGRWMVREGEGGEWEAVHVNVPGMKARDPLKETIEARPKPPMADDPRPSSIRAAPPYGAA